MACFWDNLVGTTQECPPITVDAFTTYQGFGVYIDSTTSAGDTGVVIANGVGGNITSGLGDMLGGSRDLYVSKLYAVNAYSAKAYVGVSGLFGGATSSGNKYRIQVKWDGGGSGASINYTGLGGLDWSSRTIMSLYQILSEGIAVDHQVSIYKSSSDWTRVKIASAPSYSEQDLEIALSLFLEETGTYGSYTVTKTGSGADLANIGAVVLDINRTAGSFNGTNNHILNRIEVS